jgi:hypothetical protein
MTKVTTVGIDDLIDYIDDLLSESDPQFDAMLNEAGSIIETHWKRSAERHKHVDTGDMVKKTKYSIKTKGGHKIAEIYPRGKDKRGASNAMKAFVCHYGRPNKTGSFWIDEAENDAMKEVEKRMNDMWAEYLRGK